jgi:hypothetical protein
MAAFCAENQGRTIKLGTETLQVLRIKKKKSTLLRAAAGDRWQEIDLVFPSRVGTQADPSNLRIDFKSVLEAAESLMLNSGVPANVMSKILGHSKPRVALDVYGPLYLELQIEAAKIMDGLTTPIRVKMPKKGHDIPR